MKQLVEQHWKEKYHFCPTHSVTWWYVPIYLPCDRINFSNPTARFLFSCEISNYFSECNPLSLRRYIYFSFNSRDHATSIRRWSRSTNSSVGLTRNLPLMESRIFCRLNKRKKQGHMLDYKFTSQYFSSYHLKTGCSGNVKNKKVSSTKENMIFAGIHAKICRGGNRPLSTKYQAILSLTWDYRKEILSLSQTASLIANKFFPNFHFFTTFSFV